MLSMIKSYFLGDPRNRSACIIMGKRSSLGRAWLAVVSALVALAACASQQSASTPQEATAAFAKAKRYCQTLMVDPALDPIRAKVVLMGDTAPPASMLSDGHTVSSASERVAVREWARRMARCHDESRKPQQKYLRSQQQLVAIGYADSSGALRAQLHNGQISYGQYNSDREKQRQGLLAAWKKVDAALSSAQAEALQRAEEIAQQYYQEQRAIQEAAYDQHRAYQHQHPSARCEQIGMYLYCAH
jgi:hypothetical protein